MNKKIMIAIGVLLMLGITLIVAAISMSVKVVLERETAALMVVEPAANKEETLRKLKTEDVAGAEAQTAVLQSLGVGGAFTPEQRRDVLKNLVR